MPHKNYGERIHYDPLWKGPMKVSRTHTDSIFNKVLGFFLLLWLTETIYVYYARDRNVSILAMIGIRLVTYDDSERARNRDITQFLIYDALICHSLTALMIISYIIALRWYAKLMVFFAIAFILSVLLALICYLTYESIAHPTPSRGGSIIGIFLHIGVFVGLTYLAVYLRKEIVLACILIGEASKVVMFFPSLFLLPFIQLLAYVVVLIHFVCLFCLISTLPGLSGNTPAIYILHSINLLGLYWIVNFVGAFGQMVLSGSYASWFWTLKKISVPSDTVPHVLRTTSRFHTGTLGFGSLFVTLSQFIQILIEYILKNLCCMNLVSSCLCGCCKEPWNGLTAFLHYLNKNACIMTAVHGTGLMDSGKDAFNLIARNVVNVIVTNRVKNFLLVIGYISAISVSVLIICLHEKQTDEVHEEPINFIILYIAVGSFVIVKAFLSLLSIAVDTLFLCVLEDYERNDGSDEKPYYMGEELKNLLLK